MKVKILLSIVVFFAGSIVFRNHQAEATAAQLSAQQEADVLASTLQIAMFEHAEGSGDTERGSRGLGTLVADGGKRLIITHDHWMHLTPNLHEVEFRDASGRLLLTFQAQAFRALLVYRDGGTLVLRAPAGLQDVPAAPLGGPAGEGDTVWFARRAAPSGGTTVEVVAATVTEANDAAPASLRLRNMDGSAVVPGDSGGGVWTNGRLVGNLWAAGISQRHDLLSRLFGSGDEPSDLTIAALLPLANAAP